MLENKNFAAVSAKSAATVDEGLRQYMIKVYNYMAAGLCLTAFAAYLVANTSLIRLFFNITPQGASLSGLGRHYRFHRQYLYAELRPEFCAVDSDCHHLYRPYRI